MGIEMILNSIDAVVILGVSVPALMMATRVKVPRLRTLAILLASFFVLHGLYHFVGLLNNLYGLGLYDFLSDGFLEPLSYLLLVLFAVYLYRSGA